MGRATVAIVRTRPQTVFADYHRVIALLDAEPEALDLLVHVPEGAADGRGLEHVVDAVADVVLHASI